MSSPRILVHSPRDGEAQRYADLVRAGRPEAELVVSTAPAQAEQAIGDAEIVLGWLFPESLFSKAPRLRWVHKVSAGVDDVAFDPDIPAGVMLTRTDGSLIAPRMVEYVLGAIFLRPALSPVVEAAARATLAVVPDRSRQGQHRRRRGAR